MIDNKTTDEHYAIATSSSPLRHTRSPMPTKYLPAHLHPW